MRNIAVDVSLLALKNVSHWFVTSKTLKKLDEVMLANKDTDFSFINSNIVGFFGNNMV